MDRERYHHNAHTLTDLKYHFVWKTTYSYHVLSGELALRARDILKSICAEKGLNIVKGNVRSNHIHMLVESPTHYSPAKIAQYLKGKSSYQLQREFPELRKQYWGQHLWGRGYFCATVGAVTEEQIMQYIQDQDDNPNFLVWDVKPS
jgi:putative transposase